MIILKSNLETLSIWDIPVFVREFDGDNDSSEEDEDEDEEESGEE